MIAEPMPYDRLTLEDADQAYGRELIAQLDRVTAALEHWREHIAARYQLGADDQVLLDGTIIRHPSNGSRP